MLKSVAPVATEGPVEACSVGGPPGAILVSEGTALKGLY